MSLDGRHDLCGQVYGQIRAAVVDGLLRPGEALPSTRELARRLAVSRNTVAVAYDRLVAEGFAGTRAGTGTYVSPLIRPRAPGTRGESPLRPRPVWDRVSDPPDLTAVQAEYDLRPGIPDAAHFPYGTWRALLADQLRPSAVGSGTHIDARGHPGLRVALARHIGVSRSVRADADDLLVTSGSQQAIDLVARVLLEPGDLVALEDPGYPPVHRVFLAQGCRVAGTPVDGEGLVVDALPDRARLVYVTPSHQFPLGTAMSLRRRLALLDWADRVGAVVLEDDYDSEFRYGGRPLDPLHSLDRTGRVLYVGSLSKVLLPTLRIGFLVAPAPLHAALRKAKHVTDWHGAVPMQAAAARFLDQGLLVRHIRRMLGIYAQRHHLIRAALGGEFTGILTPLPSPAGLHLTATFPPGVDDVAVMRRAQLAGVAVEALTRFAVQTPPPPGLLLGYGAIATDRLPAALQRLREACPDVVTEA